MTRRECLRFFMGGWGLFLTMPIFVSHAAAKADRRSAVDQFLGEELIFHIGYWLISHCGTARTRFEKTDIEGIYRTSLEARAVGSIDELLGRIRYTYESFSQYSEAEDRLRPLVFQTTKRRMDGEKRKRITFDYSAQRIIFSKTRSNGQSRIHREAMTRGKIYEDYLTLSYNFRHGYYGPLTRGRSYRLPIHIRKRMKSLNLQIVSAEEEKKYRLKESIKTDKDFFMQFQVDRKDVSSASGKIEGWVSSDAVPIKATLKDAILFGDLNGELIERRISNPHRVVAIPANIKNQIFGF
jgi:hypothetical protein